MKVTAIWVYPIKALRGIRLDSAHLSPQGVQYDRRFIICRAQADGELVKVQTDKNPECSLFSQEIVGDMLHVRYLTPIEPLIPRRPEHDVVLQVPLEPDISTLSRVVVNLHRSMVNAYSMGPSYDEWFSACFGFQVTFIYIGDGRRPVLGTYSPRTLPDTPQKGWLATLSGYLGSDGARPEPDWIAFSDLAPYLVTSEQSLHNVSARLENGPMEMHKFRPNIVVDGEGCDAFDEDLWAELSMDGKPIFALTKLCNRCNSINVNYDTGRLAEGDRGIVLKKLMSDRRIDPGYKWGPTFGKYTFLANGIDGLNLSVGDELFVTKRQTEIPVTDWPMTKEGARFYRYT
ncbi:Mitochondrial amidoxime-reducing component 1-like protein [Cladobotryum mycophilum]|uniref:Mitochondrial amidoxime-reducing component 1-like protein n=1 Tax=Cladobotryum mycophilum TaxID=491253 RepID=A0ABR0T2N4_9HYPO